VAVVMPPFCLWESAWYALHGDIAKATRRWRPCVASVAGAELPVWYPSARHLARAFRPRFVMRAVDGLGAVLPPPYVRHAAPDWLAELDRRMPFSYLWADHYIAVLERR
jgi:hypothetical protein